jgi:hypothetical protein
MHLTTKKSKRLVSNSSSAISASIRKGSLSLEGESWSVFWTSRRTGSRTFVSTLGRPPWQSKDSRGLIPRLGVTTVRIDTRHLAEEATLLERRSRTYVLITGMTILFAAFGFIWLTW